MPELLSAATTIGLCLDIPEMSHERAERRGGDAAAHMHDVPPLVRVCVTGAESTGSTTMAMTLAEHFRTVWVPEYGRDYTIRRQAELGADAPWTSDEFVTIARRQCELEEEASLRAGLVPVGDGSGVAVRLLIADTDALSTSIWHERYLGARHPEVDEIAASRHYDLYLLTDCDIPFEADDIRDGEHLRPWMTQRMRQVLAETGTEVVELSGTHEVRCSRAIAAIHAAIERRCLRERAGIRP